MNTKPDETTLARWLEDELQGAELAACEALIQGDEELLARRLQVREWRAAIAAAIPAVIDPPYPEFFNSRIEKTLREQLPGTLRTRHAASFWRAWWMPATSAAGMALTFWVGTKTGTAPQVAMTPSPAPVPTVVQMPAVYTPERGVDAEWFSSADAAATVIVLEGVDAIPDSLDFFKTVGSNTHGESTAALEDTEHEEGRQ